MGLAIAFIVGLIFCLLSTKKQEDKLDEAVKGEDGNKVISEGAKAMIWAILTAAFIIFAGLTLAVSWLPLPK